MSSLKRKGTAGRSFRQSADEKLLLDARVPDFFCICSAAALEISMNVSFRLPSTSISRSSSALARLPLVFSRNTSSISIISRAPSRSRKACPVRGSAMPPSIAAALRVKKSTSIWNDREDSTASPSPLSCGWRLSPAAGAAAWGFGFDCASLAAFLAASSSQRRSWSAASLRSSPSSVNNRLSMTLKPSSFCSATRNVLRTEFSTLRRKSNIRPCVSTSYALPVPRFLIPL